MNLLQAAGSHSDQDSKFAPIFTNRFFLGIVSNRNPLRSPVGIIQEKFYQIGGTDTLIAGSNTELSDRLTIIRRPGNTAGLSGILSSANIPDIPDSFYSFHEINGVVRVIFDSPSSPYLLTSSAVIPLFAKPAGVTQTYFQGVGQSLYMTDLKEQLKWLDYCAGNPGNSFTTVTAVQLTSNVATYTSQNNFAVGQTVEVSGTTTSSGEFNISGVVTANNFNATLGYSTTFSMALTGSNVNLTSDSGYASGAWNWGIV